MIRGTTPTLEFMLPFDTSVVSDVFITFAQGRKEILNKTLADCACEGEKLTLRLSQEETLKLSSFYTTEIQIRVKTKTGEALASDIMSVHFERILKDGVI